MKEPDIILKLTGIKKSFSKVEVLHGLDFELRRGEVHALVGENGAGKSTLVKVISGVHKQTEGTFIYEGEEVSFSKTLDAIEKGISIVHQEFNLIPAFSIADNIYLGRETVKGPFLVENDLHKKAEEIVSSLKLDAPVNTLVRNLTVAQQQLVEIAKCISTDAKVVILDEPTAPLSIDETEKLFSLIRDLRENGISIIYISHRLDEIFQISDRVSVLRDGCSVGTYETARISKPFLISKMVGRELGTIEKRPVDKSSEIVLSVSGLNCNAKKLRDISFDLRKGEILGFSGLVGAGRTELFQCIFGITPFESGKIDFKCRTIKKPKINEMIDSGMGYVPEDRKLHGILTRLNVRENLTLANIKACLSSIFISRSKENRIVDDMTIKLNIKYSKYTQKLVNLSGGNQQKISVGKWLSSNLDVLIMDEPTRGVDIGAKEEIYGIIRKLSESGIAIVIISSDMPEIIGYCDRALVMCEGRITGELVGEQITEDELMRLAVERIG